MLERLADVDIFQAATDRYSSQSERCPSCGAGGALVSYGSYWRWFVYQSDGGVTARPIQPLRFKCPSCSATHALLPDIVVPYSPYSLNFMLTALLAYFERAETVAAVCKRFGIAVSTLYKWKERLAEHKELMLGVLASLEETAPAFVRGLFGPSGLSGRLRGFYLRHAFSFMQGRRTAASRSHPARPTARAP